MALFDDIKKPADTPVLKWAAEIVLKKKQQFTKAQAMIDSECLRYMNPLTPMRTGAMIRSANIGTKLGTGEIVYLCPYARRQYYTNQGGSPGHPTARAQWFETMKTQHKDDIFRAAMRELKQ